MTAAEEQGGRPAVRWPARANSLQTAVNAENDGKQNVYIYSDIKIITVGTQIPHCDQMV